jgi:hypothetical protein
MSRAGRQLLNPSQPVAQPLDPEHLEPLVHKLYIGLHPGRGKVSEDIVLRTASVPPLPSARLRLADSC